VLTLPSGSLVLTPTPAHRQFLNQPVDHANQVTSRRTGPVALGLILEGDQRSSSVRDGGPVIPAADLTHLSSPSKTRVPGPEGGRRDSIRAHARPASPVQARLPGPLHLLYCWNGTAGTLVQSTVGEGSSPSTCPCLCR